MMIEIIKQIHQFGKDVGIRPSIIFIWVAIAILPVGSKMLLYILSGVCYGLR